MAAALRSAQIGEAVGGVLHVAAGVHGAPFGQYGGADGKAAVRRVCTACGLAGDSMRVSGSKCSSFHRSWKAAT